MKRVLVIDDSRAILQVVKKLLETLGLEVTTLSDPTKFTEVKGFNPDLILLDINMPEVFGDDVAGFFTDEWGVSAPIYFFSDIAESDLKLRAQEAGVSGYICKTWGMQRMVEKVKEILHLP